MERIRIWRVGNGREFEIWDGYDTHISDVQRFFIIVDMHDLVTLVMRAGRVRRLGTAIRKLLCEVIELQMLARRYRKVLHIA